MSYLRPVGWAYVATKRDLDVLAERLEGKMESLEQRITATLHRELNHQMRTMVLALSAMSSVMIAAMGIAIASG